MSKHDHIASFAAFAAAGVVTGLVGAGLIVVGVGVGAGTGLIVAANIVVGFAGVGTAAAVLAAAVLGDDVKTESVITGFFTGLAAGGVLALAVYGGLGQAQAAAMPNSSEHVLKLERNDRALATAFENADGRSVELVTTQNFNAPAAPVYPHPVA